MKVGRLANVPRDTNECIRPLGFTKSVTNYQECGKCGVHGSVEGIELLNCSGCRRIRYCCIEHLHADRKNHKAFCHAIIKENKRYKLEIKDIIKTGKAEAVTNAFIEAAAGGNFLVVKKLFKKRGDAIDVNAVSSGQTALYNHRFLDILVLLHSFFKQKVLMLINLQNEVVHHFLLHHKTATLKLLQCFLVLRVLKLINQQMKDQHHF